MEIFVTLVVAGLAFGLCWLVDLGFRKLFRNKAQHRSGKAVRASKRYGVIGTILLALGIAGMTYGSLLLVMGIIVALLGAALCVYYLSFGIFYDDETFLVSMFLRKAKTYRFRDIKAQQLYLVAGGNVVIELHMADGETVSVQSLMEGAYPFLDHGFSVWCAQTGRSEADCPFHDPSQSCWFPPVSEEG